MKFAASSANIADDWVRALKAKMISANVSSAADDLLRRMGLLPKKPNAAGGADDMAMGVDDAARSASGGAANAEYNAAKAANWTKPDGSTWWPPNNGAVAGTEKTITLQPGTLIDRYGNPTGYYTSPTGTPFTDRALSPMTDMNNYHVYEVVKPVQVESAEIAPWFGESGSGIQYKFGRSINDLMNSENVILREVK